MTWCHKSGTMTQQTDLEQHYLFLPMPKKVDKRQQQNIHSFYYFFVRRNLVWELLDGASSVTFMHVIAPHQTACCSDVIAVFCDDTAATITTVWNWSAYNEKKVSVTVETICWLNKSSIKFFDYLMYNDETENCRNRNSTHFFLLSEETSL